MGSTLKAKKILLVAGMTTLGLLVTLVVYVYFSAIQALQDFSFFSKAVLHPRISAKEKYDAEPVPGIKKVSLFIPCADGSKMHAWLFKKPGADKLMIVNHGAGGNLIGRTYIAKAATKANCSSLLYDYRGYARSTGDYNLDTILEDGLTVYDYARKDLGYPAEKIILCGESIGSAVAAQTAAARPCAGVLILCGVSQLTVAIRKIFPMSWIIPDSSFAKTKIDNPTTFKSVHVPVLFIHGRLDEQVPFESSQANFAAASEPKKIVLLPGCGHDDLGVFDGELFQKSISDFVESLK